MLKKWWQLYANDDEKNFFVGKDGVSGLIRHPKFKERSLKALASEAGLTEERTEQILNKYLKMNIVVASDGGDKYAYWEKVSSDEVKPGVVKADQDERVKKAKP